MRGGRFRAAETYMLTICIYKVGYFESVHYS